MLDAGQFRSESSLLSFPFKKQPFCRYEPIEKKIDYAKILIVNDLLRYEDDLSDLAREEWGESAESKLKFERTISGMALNNIAGNIVRLVKHPKTLTVHLSEIADAAADFNPDAIVMSGTLADFEYYNPQLFGKFKNFITTTTTPVLAICGAHQLVGEAFGAKVLTLDNLNPWQKRNDRVVEYQYRFIKILDKSDPIFAGIRDAESGLWQDYTKESDIIRVWQNHGLKVASVPSGFELLATSYLCRNQMMVKRSDNQLIYSVQFHLEKSFEDWNKTRTRWEHQNESRDGRVLFENFLKLALEKR